MSGSEVLRYTDAEIKKGGQLLKYPVTKMQKFMRFPIGLHFNSYSYYRALSLCIVFYGTLWYKVSRPMVSETNRAKFLKIHQKRLHSRFDPIHE